MGSNMMKTMRALEIVRALSDGVDPYTGEVYPAGSIYQNAETVRALYAAIAALEAAHKREMRKKALPCRAGQPWDDEESSLLISRYEQSIGIKELAEQHERTKGAIVSQLTKLGKNPDLRSE